MAGKKSIWSRLGFWALYAFVTLALVVTVVEVAVRVMGVGPRLGGQSSAFVADPVLPYRPRPSFVLEGRSKTNEYDYSHHHNSLGYRDVEHELDKPEGVFRILGLGDSFTVGWGADFEETYLRRLEVSLNGRPGDHPPVEIIKAGISGYFAETERMLLEHEGIRFEPDVVLVGFTANDPYDTYRGVDAVRVSKQGVLTTQEAEQMGELAVWLYRNVHFTRIPLSRLTRRRQPQLQQGWWNDLYRSGGMFDEAYEKILSEYETMDRIASDAGARLVVLNIPIPRKGEPYQTYPGDVLKAWGEKRGVPVIDALPAMEAASARAELFWEKDGHCTPAGYRVIAEVLHEELTGRGLVP